MPARRSPQIREKTKVWVALSGGVDSSTAAALLVERGFEVEGVFMELLDCALMPLEGRRTCCSPMDRADAQRVAERLRIPFHVVDFKAQFRERIIEEFASQYRKGRTPNPCVRCNQWIKFDLLLRKALDEGADYLATGHYARVIFDTDAGVFRLLRGRDGAKDQSYFLFPMGQEQLSRVIWPLGELTKSQVRTLARRMGLPVADKQESQEICFIPTGDYKTFLIDYLGEETFEPGEIVDEEGRVLGRHRGVQNFTVGQRRGLRIPWREPLYVISILPERRQVVVGPKSSLNGLRLLASDAIWPAGCPPSSSFRATVKIRYRHPEAPATVDVLDGDRVRVTFDEPQAAITPGQAVVIYMGDEVMGGAWIERQEDGHEV
jgi:tRNA-specific 2-thiouridylase